jgi:hypothetical protein
VIWRVLAALAGLLLGALWFFGSGLALGLAECPTDTGSGLCAPRHEDLLAVIEAALVLGGTVLAVGGGLLSAWTGRAYWLVAAVVVIGVLGLAADVVLAGQEQPPG